MQTYTFITWSLYEMHNIFRKHIIFLAHILLCSSALRVHDSQTCRKMDATRERISRIAELRDMLLLFQTGFKFVNAADVCVILKSITGFVLTSVT